MDNLFFNPNHAQEFAPQIWLGGYNSLLTSSYSSNFIDDKNIKIIINCGNTHNFLEFLHTRLINSISSDVIILSLDPSFNPTNNHQDLIQEFVVTYKKKLRNYLQSFYLNEKDSNLIHDFPDKENNFDGLLSSPILSGANLKLHFFQLNRLIKLFKNVNQSVSVLLVSSTGNNSLSTGLAISYLMDHYNYQIAPSFNLIQNIRPSLVQLNMNFYDDLIIVENLKRFYEENSVIKLNNPNYLLTNCKLKRKQVDDDDSDMISAGGDASKRFKY